MNNIFKEYKRAEFMNELESILSNLSLTPKTCFLLGFSVGLCPEYRTRFSTVISTMIRLNNLGRACIITPEKKQELLMMLYKGIGIDVMNQKIKEIQIKSIKECPHGYSIGVSSIDTSEYKILQSNYI